jgi:hypothetical protein
MDKKMKRNYGRFNRSICVLVVSIMAVFFQGCGGEWSSKEKITAEFKFDAGKDKKVLVLVNQPSWLNAPPLLHQELTEQIQKRLTIYAGLGAPNLVSYENLSEFRLQETAFSSMTAAQIGKALNADWVLVADLTDYKFVVEESSYYGGTLTGRTFIINVDDSRKLWPADSESRKINVSFDIEDRGSEEALRRLAGAFAHCTTRYFFDCPKNKFKIAEDKSNPVWSEWGD